MKTSKPEYKVYTQKDLFLNPTDPEMPYRRRKDEEKTGIHWGQRKLLLTLIQFLSLFWDPKKVPKPIVVYAGAAPGTNIAIVSQLFPEIEFHLYDPAPFKIRPSGRIHLYQQYFEDGDAKKWAGRKDVFFVSDIRTADYQKTRNLDEYENQIQKDMNMQMVWVQIINPSQAHLKLRFPYTGGGRPSHVNYLYGYVLKQPWAPQTTTETRLVPVRDNSGNWITAEWSSQKYQDQLFYHNVIIREQFKYLNPFDNKDTPIDSPELLNDWDSRTEAQIWMDYLSRRGVPITGQSVIALSRLITRKLTENSRYKDTLHILRSNPQFIKKRNMQQTRDDLGGRTLPSRERGTQMYEARDPIFVVPLPVSEQRTVHPPFQPPPFPQHETSILPLADQPVTIPTSDIVPLGDQPVQVPGSKLAKQIGLE